MRYCPLTFLGDISAVVLAPGRFAHTNVITSSTPNCRRYTSCNFRCDGKSILNDGNFGPMSEVDLKNANDSKQFVGWADTNIRLYLSIQLQETGASTTTIELYMLNNPYNNIGIPNFQLYATNRVGYTSLNIDLTQDAEEVQFDLLNNHFITRSDNNVRKIILRLQKETISKNFLITWSFANLLNTQWVALSEVRICGDRQHPVTASISGIRFIEPPVFIYTVQPSPSALEDGSIDLICSVAGQGSISWTWSSRDHDLTNYTVKNGDASKTSALTIHDLGYEDSGLYSCEATYFIENEQPSQLRSFRIQYPCKFGMKVE